MAPMTILIIAMVEVVQVGRLSSQVNVALNKPTDAGGDYRSTTGRAVDGNVEQAVGYCANIIRGPTSALKWWMVDLEDTYFITSVKLYNRNSFGYRLRNFTFEISIQPPSNLTGFPGFTNSPICVYSNVAVPTNHPASFDCPYPMYGRYVRMLKYGYNALTVCEIQVYGIKVPKFRKANSSFISTLPSETVAGLSALQDCLRVCVCQLLACNHIGYHADGTCLIFNAVSGNEDEQDNQWAFYDKI